MMHIDVTGRDGRRARLAVDAGSVLMEVLRDADFDVEAVCGGCCSCATCHIYTDLDRVGSAGEVERGLLQATEVFDETRSRLSCQIQLDASLDALQVVVAPEE